MLRTHTCGELRGSDAKKTVTLSGWVTNPKNHGSVFFCYLRDRYGMTQLIFNADNNELFSQATQLKREYVISVTGLVKTRAPDLVNKKFSTGEIEVEVQEMKILSKAEQLPIEIEGDINTSEEMRLKYRYLDLRRPEMIEKLKLRSDVMQAARNYFIEQGFLEIETPLMVKSTPEGARDYIVPSRVNQGMFYALPQSPQLYKQILMIAGMDKYFQIARCLRDEDLRADRQPEHTQFDFEMSFVTSDQIRELVEGLIKHIFKTVKGMGLDTFQTFSYKEAMDMYGIDKPDLRFEMKLIELTNIVNESGFKVFSEAEYTGCIVVEKEFSRKEIDKLTDVCKKAGAKGLAFAKVENGTLDGGISKFLDEKIQQEILLASKAKNNSTILFIADQRLKAQKVLGILRNTVAKEIGLLEGKEFDFKFCWVKDFPLFSYNEDEKKWDPEHHMFSMPNEEFVDDFEQRPAEVTGNLWDLVLNGIELASGSMRVSNPQVQERIMNFVGFDKEAAHEKFGFLLEAYKYGGPVHGGMGIGADRIIALMAGTNDIREVIAFPKNKNAQCPMDNSPNKVDQEQLDELGISLKK